LQNFCGRGLLVESLFEFGRALVQLVPKFGVERNGYAVGRGGLA
jgi:hypothetical protein